MFSLRALALWDWGSSYEALRLSLSPKAATTARTRGSLGPSLSLRAAAKEPAAREP